MDHLWFSITTCSPMLFGHVSMQPAALLSRSFPTPAIQTHGVSWQHMSDFRGAFFVSIANHQHQAAPCVGCKSECWNPSQPWLRLCLNQARQRQDVLAGLHVLCSLSRTSHWQNPVWLSIFRCPFWEPTIFLRTDLFDTIASAKRGVPKVLVANPHATTLKFKA